MEKKYPFIGETNKPLNVYSKFTFEEFWKFINPKEEYIYELRIKSNILDKKDVFNHIKHIGQTYRVPYHWTGVFCQNWKIYEKICIYCVRNKLTLYLSANPKRKSNHGEDKIKWKTYNGKMQSDLCVYSILLDFDPEKDFKKAFNNTDEEAYRVAKKFLEEHKNIKKYVLLSTGNGCQCRIPLDEPIYLPKDTYDENNKFIITKEFNVYRRMLKEAIKPIVEKYKTKNIAVDTTSLELARVGRSPFSKNYKDENNVKFSGIIELVDEGENSGLTAHIMSYYDRVEKNNQAEETFKDIKILKEYTYGPETIHRSALAKMLLSEELPHGGRNNILFFQFKLLCKNNNISLKHEKVQKLIEDFRRVQSHSFTDNMPDQGEFSPEAINNYCLEYKIKPVFDILPKIENRKRRVPDITYDDNVSSVGLGEGKNIVWKLRNYIRGDNINFHNNALFKRDINKLLGMIAKSYDKDTVVYLLESGILKEMLEKL
jgi:hypothetical protein